MNGFVDSERQQLLQSPAMPPLLTQQHIQHPFGSLVGFFEYPALQCSVTLRHVACCVTAPCSMLTCQWEVYTSSLWDSVHSKFCARLRHAGSKDETKTHMCMISTVCSLLSLLT